MDIQECFKILAARKACENGHGHDHHHDHEHKSCENLEQHIPVNVDENSEVKGQVIDMAKDEQEAEAAYRERLQRHLADVEAIFFASMPELELAPAEPSKFSAVKLSLEAQEYRTAIYKVFDNFFKWVCKDIERHVCYTAGIRHVTAHFQNASDRVMKCARVCGVEAEYCRKYNTQEMRHWADDLCDYENILNRLQRLEKQHLTYIAAYHADTLKASREKAKYLRSESGKNAEYDGVTMKQKIMSLRESIEECVSELKGSDLFVRVNTPGSPKSDKEILSKLATIMEN